MPSEEWKAIKLVGVQNHVLRPSIMKVMIDSLACTKRSQTDNLVSKEVLKLEAEGQVRGVVDVHQQHHR